MNCFTSLFQIRLYLKVSYKKIYTNFSHNFRLCIKIPVAKMETWNKCHIDNPQILGSHSTKCSRPAKLSSGSCKFQQYNATMYMQKTWWRNVVVRAHTVHRKIPYSYNTGNNSYHEIFPAFSLVCQANRHNVSNFGKIISSNILTNSLSTNHPVSQRHIIFTITCKILRNNIYQHSQRSADKYLIWMMELQNVLILYY